MRYFHIAVFLTFLLMLVGCATTKTIDSSSITDISKEAYVIQEKDLADLTSSNTSQQTIQQITASRLETISEKLDELEKTIAAEKAGEYASGYTAGYEKAITDVRENAKVVEAVE